MDIADALERIRSGRPVPADEQRHAFGLRRRIERRSRFDDLGPPVFCKVVPDGEGGYEVKRVRKGGVDRGEQ